MKKILVHLAEGFEEVEAIAPVDVLRRAGFEVAMVSITGNKLVTGSHGIVIQADQLFEEADYSKADMIVLPGGPGSKNLDNHEGLKDQIKQFNHHGKPLAAICAAPMVLAHLGILRGKNITCFPGTEIHLEGSRITGKAVEVDGTIITGKGMGVAVKFGLAIVEYFSGKVAAEALAKKIIAE
jgi:protein deglycase